MGSVGDLIAGRYRLEAPLGSGGYGEVWRAFDTHRRHTVALKLMKGTDRRATWHEASLLTALSSQHILPVNNADVAVDVPYLDTALAKCSLDAVSEPWGVEPGTAIDWIRRALRGLDLCHRRGLLHRDVKPHNVFLTQEGDARLGDFGVAAIMDAAESADPHGDPRIRAPEFYTGGRATRASDVYSAAVTLYALLAGHLPFAHCITMPELQAAIENGDCPDLRDAAPHVSQALADRVRQGMALVPSHRFGTAAEFDSALSLPARSRQFTPMTPHAGHERCWRAEGKGTDLDVCVLDGTKSGHKCVETRHTKSGNHVKQHCDEVKERDLPKRLRKVFNRLR